MPGFSFRARYASLCALSVALSLVSVNEVLRADDEKAGTEIRGIWKLVSVEVDGETRQIEEDVRWVFQRDSAQGDKVFYGGEVLAALSIYAMSRPKGLDLSFVEPKQTYEGIYELDQDELKVCLNTRTLGAKERPFSFATKEKADVRVLRFQKLPDGTPETLTGYIGMQLATEDQAVVVTMVLEKSPAERAGIRAGDTLLTVGEDKTTDLQATVDLIRGKTPGARVIVRVRREGQEKEIAVSVGVFPFALLGLLG